MGDNFEVEGHIGELSPGSTPRRWEPEIGINKHRAKIHRESRYADEHKNLPFSFSKPKKVGRRALFECTKCGHVIYTGINAVGMICPECKQYVELKEVEISE